MAPDWAVLLVNRAMCQKHRERWDDVESDSRRALTLDPRSMKVHSASLSLPILHELNTACAWVDPIFPDSRGASFDGQFHSMHSLLDEGALCFAGQLPVGPGPQGEGQPC